MRISSYIKSILSTKISLIFLILLVFNPWNLYIFSGHQSFVLPAATSIPSPASDTNPLDLLLLHSTITNQIHQFFSAYFNFFSPRFLAFDSQWLLGSDFPPYLGSLLFPSFIFFIIGFYVILSQKINRLNLLVISLLLLSPFFKSALIFSVSLTYFATLGINFTITKYKSIYLKLFILVTYLLSFLYYFDLRLFHHL